MTNYLVKMEKISKSFFGQKANEDVDFYLEKGKVNALLGENGAGKTTLMNILTGVYMQDSGTIELKGKKINFNYPGDALKNGVGMVHQRLSLVGCLTVLENLILGISSNKFVLNMKERKSFIQSYMKKYNFSLPLDEVVDDLPIGVRQKVEILKMLVREVDVLIVDEPTTVLTKQEANNLMEILKSIAKMGKGVIFITHKMSEVFEVADFITVMRKGKKITTLKNENIEPLELSKLMVGEKTNTISFDREKCNFNDYVLEVNDLTVFSQGKNVPVVNNITLKIKKGEILGIAGVTGNGQLELAEAIVGMLKPKFGKILLNGEKIEDFSIEKRITKGISYVPSDRINVGVAGKRSIWENTSLKIFRNKDYKKGIFLNNDKLKKYSYEIIKKYDVYQPGIEYPALLLSGGNLQKIIIGREIEADSSLYIFDYPTRGLDVGATDFVRKTILSLRNSGKAVLLISGDFDEIFGLADNIAVMYEGKFTGYFENGKYGIEHIGLMMSGTYEGDVDKQMKCSLKKPVEKVEKKLEKTIEKQSEKTPKKSTQKVQKPRKK